jgi:AcrR family transcriptional regulator
VVGSTVTKSSARIGRRQAILDAATRLFSSRGYADTGIDDIGEAVGITGPAVYRHFASKQELLVAVLERAVVHAESIAPGVRSKAGSPEDTLRRVIDELVTACIEDRALTAIYWQQSANLPEGPRRELERAQREMIDEFAGILRAVRTDLTPSEARAAVFAASALMRSVAQRSSSLGEDTLHRLLASMAYAALLAGTPLPERA